MAAALLDTNVLVHAAYKALPLHAAAATLVDRGLAKKGAFCLAPQSLVEFAAVVTRQRFVNPPLAPPKVREIVDMLYTSRRPSKIYLSRATVQRTIQHGAALGVTGTAWYDLFLAVTMRDSGVSLLISESVDDFRKIPFVTCRSIRVAAASSTWAT